MAIVTKANAKTVANRYWGDREPPKSKAEFFNAVTTPAPSGDGTVATIRLYGPIDSWGGWWGVCTQDISDVIDSLGPEVTQIILRVNSPGGEVFEGMAILNMLRAHKASVTAVVDGLAASAASVVVAGCDEAVMSPGSQMMIHSPWSYTCGNAAELRKDADVLDQIEAGLVEVYSSKAGSDRDWQALLADETWLPASAAVEMGLADRVGIVPDAGVVPTTEADEDDPTLVVVLPGDDVEDSATDWLRARAGLSPKTPVATASGPTHSEEVAMSDTTTPAETVETEAPQAVTAPVANAAVPSVDPKDAEIAMLREALATANKTAETVAVLQENQRVSEREAFLDSMSTRFTANDRDTWRAHYDAAPAVARSILESMPVIVNTVEHGFTAPSGSQTVAAAGAQEDAAFSHFAGRMGLTKNKEA